MGDFTTTTTTNTTSSFSSASSFPPTPSTTTFDLPLFSSHPLSPPLRLPFLSCRRFVSAVPLPTYCSPRLLDFWLGQGGAARHRLIHHALEDLDRHSFCSKALTVHTLSLSGHFQPHILPPLLHLLCFVILSCRLGSRSRVALARGHQHQLQWTPRLRPSPPCRTLRPLPSETGMPAAEPAEPPACLMMLLASQSPQGNHRRAMHLHPGPTNRPLLLRAWPRCSVPQQRWAAWAVSAMQTCMAYPTLAQGLEGAAQHLVTRWHLRGRTILTGPRSTNTNININQAGSNGLPLANHARTTCLSTSQTRCRPLP